MPGHKKSSEKPVKQKRMTLFFCTPEKREAHRRNQKRRLIPVDINPGNLFAGFIFFFYKKMLGFKLP